MGTFGVLLFSLRLSQLWKTEGAVFFSTGAVFFLKLISRSLSQGRAQEKRSISAEERPAVSPSVPKVTQRRT